MDCLSLDGDGCRSGDADRTATESATVVVVVVVVVICLPSSLSDFFPEGGGGSGCSAIPSPDDVDDNDAVSDRRGVPPFVVGRSATGPPPGDAVVTDIGDAVCTDVGDVVVRADPRDGDGTADAGDVAVSGGRRERNAGLDGGIADERGAPLTPTPTPTPPVPRAPGLPGGVALSPSSNANASR